MGSNSPADTFRIVQEASYILLDPREKLLPYEGETFNVQITRYNVDSIVFDATSFFGDVIKIGNDTLSITVPENTTEQSRSDTLLVCSVSNQDICDTLFVFQYAANQSYILASPRADTVLFSGDTNVVFNIMTHNLAGNLKVDESTLPEWIQYSITNNSILKLNVDTNFTAQTRDTVVWIFDENNPDISDSVFIFQYAAPEKYLLATPREQKIVHSGGIMLFEITPVNVDVWGLDTTAIPGWISDYNIAGNVLALTIDPNTSLLTREANLRIFADSIGSTVEDIVSVFQYSGLDHYLLASPRERITGNLTDTLYFVVDTVNLNTWQAEIVGGDTTWIETIISGTDTLGLVISKCWGCG